MADRNRASLHALPTPGDSTRSLALSDGSRAEVRDDALVVFDPAGRLLIRYQDGHAEISAAHGDLRLAAPAGRVIIASALDVAIEAGRDISQRAGRSIEIGTASERDAAQLRIDPAAVRIRSDTVEVAANAARAVVVEASFVAHAITSSAERIAITVGRYERVAEQVTTRAKDSYREIADLAEERVGRLRALVRDVYSLSSRRTVMTSSDDTSIDGSRIHLG